MILDQENYICVFLDGLKHGILNLQVESFKGRRYSIGGPINILRDATDAHLPILITIMNSSIKQHEVPNELKLAHALLLFSRKKVF